MKKADVKVGAIVGAKSEEELKKPFQGKVEKILLCPMEHPGQWLK